MAVTNIPKPPRKAKGEPPARIETRQNLSKPNPTETETLTFRVSADFKKNFKVAAASIGITQSELLEQAFDIWKSRHG